MPVFPFRSVVALVALGALAAGCGPSGSAVPGMGFDDYLNAEASLVALAAPLGVTQPSALPASGTAQFDGVMVLTAETGGGPLDMTGGLTLTADFAASTISGQANAFVDELDRPLAGTLAVTNGAIDRSAVVATDPTFTADLAGRLKGAAGQFDINAVMAGDFWGSGATMLQGTLTGTADGPVAGGYLFGSFIAAAP